MGKAKTQRNKKTALQKWITSREGRRAIRQTAERIRRAEEELAKARRVDPLDMIRPIQDWKPKGGEG